MSRLRRLQAKSLKLNGCLFNFDLRFIEFRNVCSSCKYSLKIGEEY